LGSPNSPHYWKSKTEKNTEKGFAALDEAILMNEKAMESAVEAELMEVDKEDPNSQFSSTALLN
jgi:hypothetical protein